MQGHPSTRVTSRSIARIAYVEDSLSELATGRWMASLRVDINICIEDIVVFPHSMLVLPSTLQRRRVFLLAKCASADDNNSNCHSIRNHIKKTNLKP